ncbi:hypothetical protein H9W91_07470 [Streptomyces alfalfae]|uniref:hypothetical protein n=1 Tax=Streptomyces alfalfae TaxID=1642299 RepID=UPI001BA86DCC|nr:hypothetical protein [Streptomyces alfalfae]QUI30716.1 hypothetical protein H9W91_07470 [Streptomyces alfalfae]
MVDWDFFFPTPTAGAPLGEHPELYAWPVTEDALHVEAIWLRRVRAFIKAGVALPLCQGFLGFWNRFTIAPNATLFYADSNAWACQVFPSNLGGSGPWESVHLYDAHHDCGYKQNDRSFEDWKAGVLSGRKKISAENWMLAHYWNGSQVFVHFPWWRKSMARPTEHPLIPVSMTIDNGQTPDVAFNAVFLCRSGAWVPPWCDHQFADFLSACPVARRVEMPQNQWTQPRPDVLRMVELENRLKTSPGLTDEVR